MNHWKRFVLYLPSCRSDRGGFSTRRTPYCHKNDTCEFGIQDRCKPWHPLMQLVRRQGQTPNSIAAIGSSHAGTGQTARTATGGDQSPPHPAPWDLLWLGRNQIGQHASYVGFPVEGSMTEVISCFRQISSARRLGILLPKSADKRRNASSIWLFDVMPQSH